MVTYVTSIEEYVGFLVGRDSRDQFDPLLVLDFHSLQQRSCIPTSVLGGVYLLMALIADQHEIAEAVEVFSGDLTVAARPVAFEGVDVGLLCNVHLLLSHR